MPPPNSTPQRSPWFQSLAAASVHDPAFMAFDQFAQWACGFDTLPTAWTLCPRPDWLLWLAVAASKSEDEVRPVVLAACECARRALTGHRIPHPEAWAALEAATRWVEGACDCAHVVQAGKTALAVARDVSGSTLGDSHARRLAVFAAGACANIAANAGVLHGAVPATNETLRMRQILCDNAGGFPASSLTHLRSSDHHSEAYRSAYVTINQDLAEIVRAEVPCPDL